MNHQKGAHLVHPSAEILLFEKRSCAWPTIAAWPNSYRYLATGILCTGNDDSTTVTRIER